jgi:hypothetical protein
MHNTDNHVTSNPSHHAHATLCPISSCATTGHAFDRDDLVMRLSRNPCDKELDCTKCTCKEPCRKKFYSTLVEIRKQTPGVAGDMFPPLLAKFLDAVENDKPGTWDEQMRRSHLVEGFQNHDNDDFHQYKHNGGCCGKIFSHMPPASPPGPVEFFVAHGSYQKFPDAVTVDMQLIELIDLDEQRGCFEVKMCVSLQCCCMCGLCFGCSNTN